MIGRQRVTNTSPVESFLSRYWLSFRHHLGSFWKLCFPAGYWVYQWAPTVHPSWLSLFLHTFEYDFMVKIMKQDITKAIQFRNIFRYINYLFSINNVDLGNYISAIYPSELEHKDTSTSSAEVCYRDTNIKTGRIMNTPSVSAFTIREMTLHSGLSPFLIWTATFPPI